MVATPLRTSIRFTKRVKGRTASVSDHTAVRDAIARRDPGGARTAMKGISGDVLEPIDHAEDTPTGR